MSGPYTMREGNTMAKRKTNTAFIKYAMEHSQYGSLKQSFIIAALDSYARQVMINEELNPMKGFVDNSVWQGIAHELNKEISEQYSA